MKKSTKLMLATWAAVLTFGFIEPTTMALLGEVGSSVIFSIVLNGFVFCWFVSDAEDMDYEPSRLLKIAVIVIGIIAIPYYLIKVKGFKRALLSFLKFLGFLISLILIIGTAGYFMFHYMG